MLAQAAEELQKQSGLKSAHGAIVMHRPVAQTQSSTVATGKSGGVL